MVTRRLALTNRIFHGPDGPRRWRLALVSGVVVLLAVVVAGAAVMRSDSAMRTPARGGAVTDEARALDEARRLGKPVRVDRLTSGDTEVWARPQGDFRADLSVGDVRMRRDGNWIPVDLNLRAAGENVTAIAHPKGLTLAGARSGGTNELAAVGSGEDRVAMQWTGPLPVPVLDGPTATYRDVLRGVDLVVQATREGFAQSLVVKDRVAADRVGSVRLPLTGPGAATFSRDAVGTITLAGPAGKTTATIAQPRMWDATVDATGTPRRSAVVRTTAARTVDGTQLTLTPDRAWLRDRTTVYPVTVDPTVAAISDTFDIYVKEGVTTPNDTTNDLQVGLLSGGKRTRAFLTWNTAVLSGKQITAASVKFFNFWSNVCAAKSWEIWPTATATPTSVWSNQPAFLGTAPHRRRRRPRPRGARAPAPTSSSASTARRSSSASRPRRARAATWAYGPPTRPIWTPSSSFAAGTARLRTRCRPHR